MKKVMNPKGIVRAKDNSAMSAAFDAYGKTEDGKALIVEVKAIGPRVTKLRELAHSTIMEMTKNTHWYRKRFYQLMKERKWGKKPTVTHPFDLFKAAKPVLRELAVKGGDDYKAALMTLQFTWSSRKTLNDTVKLILE